GGGVRRGGAPPRLPGPPGGEGHRGAAEVPHRARETGRPPARPLDPGTAAPRSRRGKERGPRRGAAARPFFRIATAGSFFCSLAAGRPRTAPFLNLTPGVEAEGRSPFPGPSPGRAGRFPHGASPIGA